MICNILPKRTIMECISYLHIFLMEFIHGGDIFVISQSSQKFSLCKDTNEYNNNNKKKKKKNENKINKLAYVFWQC